MKKLYCLLILITCVILCACSKSSAVVYCDNISFANEYIQSGITMHVGETFTLSNDAVVMIPATANVGYTIESDNNNIVSTEDKVLIAKAEGIAHIIAKALQSKDSYVASDRVVVTVLPAPIYVPADFDFTIHEFNAIKGESFVNKITNSHLVNVSNAFEVTYSVPSVVSYDAITGIVAPLGVGITRVNIKCRVGESEYKTIYFDVCVNEYATSVVLKGNPTEVLLYEDAAGTFEYASTPSDYSFGVIFESNNSCFEVEQNGNYHAIHTGVAKLKLTYVTKGGISTYVIYDVRIIPKHTELNVTLDGNTHFASFTGMAKSATYSLEISSNVSFETSDIANLEISGIDISAITCSNGKFIVTYTHASSGDKTICVVYHLHSYDYDGHVQSSASVHVYDFVTELVVSSYPVNIVDGGITLHACSTGEHDNSTALTISHNNASTSLGYDVIVGDDSIISYSNGVVTALSAGTTTLTISMKDNYLDNYNLSVSVLDCVAQTIELQVAQQLYVGNLVEGYSSSSPLVVTLHPACAIDQISVQTNSENLIYSNGIITAFASGNYTITVNGTNVTQSIDIVVYDMPQDLKITYDNNEVDDGDNLELYANIPFVIEISTLFNGESTDTFFQVEVTTLSSNVVIDRVEYNTFAINCSEAKSVSFVVTFGNITKTFVVQFSN